MGIGNIADSGMQAAMTNMEVISNNIANANTYGFKKSTVNFADIYASSTNASGNQPGIGVDVSSINQNFSAGGFNPTGNATDLAIKQNGFFVLQNPLSGQTAYTRNGSFVTDDNGYLLFGDKISRLQGFPAVNNVIQAGDTPTDLKIDFSPIPAQATANVKEVINLSAGNQPIVAPFDPTNSSTYSYNTNCPDVYDSLGNAHPMVLYFINTAPNTYTVQASIDGQMLSPAINGSVTFTPSGALNTVSGLNAISFTPATGQVLPQVINVDLTGSTGFGNPNASNSIEPDGFAAGTYNSVSIDNNGVVNALYTNGQTMKVGQIAIADFQSPSGLSDIGNMSWVPSTLSGQPVISQGNSLANIVANNLELSNVDLSTEMINLIGAQHSFQANAQVAQTYNEVMQTVIQL